MANRWASMFGLAAKQRPSATRLPKDFDKQRLVTSFNFYHQSAESAHLKYGILKVTQIVAGALIPVMAVILKNDPNFLNLHLDLGSTTAVLGALVTGIESYIQFSQCQQNWIRWRGAAEGLVREAFLYSQSVQPYDVVGKRDSVLAETVEAIVAAEQQTWKTTLAKPVAAPGK